MTFVIRVSGTEHIDDYHHTTSIKEYANEESFYEVMDDLVTSASMQGWTNIHIDYQKQHGDTWYPVIRE